MNGKGKFDRAVWSSTAGDVRKGALKYVEAMAKVMEKIEYEGPMAAGINMVYIGYAAGVIAGKTSDCGIEGFTSLLNGINLSLQGEDRKEMMQYAIWDKYGNLHTSEELFRTEKGGEV